jgi:hypothetical protein
MHKGVSPATVSALRASREILFAEIPDLTVGAIDYRPSGPRLPQLRLLPPLMAALVLTAGCFSQGNSAPPKVATTPPAVAPPSTTPSSITPPTKLVEPAAESPKAPPLFDGWPKPALALVVTGQQLGYIEPCGCTGLENQKGGLARRQTLIEQLAKDRGWAVLPLDVGNQVKRFGKQQEIKLAHALRGLRTMGYGAIALGEHDLKLPADSLYGMLMDRKTDDIVSANVEVLDPGAQKKYLVLQAGGKKIGVTAVLCEKFEQKLTSGDLVHQPPIKALKEFCRDLDAQGCDLKVLLVHGSLDEARDIAEDLPLFDLVVAAGETSLPSRELETVKGTKTRLMQVGLKAMYAGVIAFYDDPKTPFRYESVPLDARFADSPAMLKLLADYQQALKDHSFAELGLKPRPHLSGNKFVGSDKCGECHSQAFAVWSKTPHAHATDSLVKPPNSRGDIARHFDAECLSCHVTGWEPQQFTPFASGYLSLEQTPLLAHNGCENCHGPGSAHAAAESGEGNVTPDMQQKLREAMKLPLAGGKAEQKCLECHDDDNSPDFHKPGAFEKYWKKVEHKGKD